MSAWWGPLPTTRARRPVFEPGAVPSSATFSTNDEGRLSITNQPRSSRLSAAWERPAPESPAMTRMSVTEPEGTHHPGRRGGHQASSRFDGPQVEQPGNGGRVHVLVGEGQESRRGGGLLHPLD